MTALALGGALALGSTAAASAAAPGTHPALSAAQRMIATEAAGSAHASQPAPSSANSGSAHVCSAVVTAGQKACMALKRNGVHAAAAVSPNAIPSGVGYGPSQLQSAYNLTSASAADGSGRTIAVVDAYDDANAAGDLAAYRSAAGLPTVPSFKKVNQSGATSPLPSAPPSGDDWTLEESLDLDMASAICPLCNIVLVEANDDTSNGLYVANNAAASLAGYISNSWGGGESSTDTSSNSQYFSHASGIVTTASAGDSDYGVIYPATSPNVVSVGGTALKTSSSSRGWTESVWNTTTGSEGTGSGCSAYETQPSWQTSLGLSGCTKRIDNDVAADADPATGVAVYDTSNGNSGWNEVGGTSASSPMVAAMYALGGNAGANPADDIYTHTSNFYDVTSGNDGSCSPAFLCTAETGYDGPTGIGTPNGIAGLQTGSTGGGNTVSVTNPGSRTGTVGTAVSLQISASDSASGQTLSYSATGLPAGLSISGSGLISGTPTTAATSNVTVTATDTTGASGSASFSWAISTSGGGGGCSAAQLVTNPGFETGAISPWSSTSGVLNNSSSEPAHSGSWDAWLDGYGTTHTDTLSQKVTIPSTCTTATFSFWLHIDTSETTTGTAYDTLKVQVLNSSGTVLTTLATFSNLNHNTGYTQHSYSLASYIGQAVTLKFTGSEDSSLQTSFVDDDNAVNVG
ncbi:MAG TPA: putative Ig domain-containing protein [Actinospica sp.]|nr:putative Ig domain-containing protein [Actinospica sp.]HWG27774.1 putative Ig domain-containing protein [Actinospica sp.]